MNKDKSDNSGQIEHAVEITQQNSSSIEHVNRKNRIKKFLDESPFINVIVIVFSVCGFLMGLVNGYFTLFDKISERSESISIDYTAINMYAEDLSVNADDYQKLFLTERVFYPRIPFEPNQRIFVELMAVGIDLKITNQKRDPKSISSLRLFIQPVDTEVWLESQNYQLVDKKISVNPITRASIHLGPREIKNCDVKFYFGPDAKKEAKKSIKNYDIKCIRCPILIKDFYLLATDEQGKTYRTKKLNS